jgi:hypothetical protein
MTIVSSVSHLILYLGTERSLWAGSSAPEQSVAGADPRMQQLFMERADG